MKDWNFVQRFPRIISATSMLLYYILGYFIIGQISANWDAHQPKLYLDSLFPLKTSWVFIYGFVYIFAFIPVPVIVDPPFFRQVAKAYAFILTISFITYFIYPTSFARPLESLQTSHFFDWALGVIWFLDPPRNCMPSLHVSSAFLSAIAVYKLHRGVGVFSIITASAIAVSTLYTHQHYILDIVFGFLLALIASFIFTYHYPREKISEINKKKAPQRALIILGGYFILFMVFYVAFSMGISVPHKM